MLSDLAHRAAFRHKEAVDKSGSLKRVQFIPDGILLLTVVAL